MRRVAALPCFGGVLAASILATVLLTITGVATAQETPTGRGGSSALDGQTPRQGLNHPAPGEPDTKPQDESPRPRAGPAQHPPPVPSRIEQTEPAEAGQTARAGTEPTEPAEARPGGRAEEEVFEHYASGGELDAESLIRLSIEELLALPVSVATKTAMKASEAPSILTLIPRSTIVGMGYRTIGEALRSVPGFFLIDDLVTENVAVRGVHPGPDSWSRVIKVMVNGHPATYHTTGGTLLGPEFIPIDVVESIEVIRGTGSALYGANAFLGVVNVVTRRPQKEGAHLQASMEVGTVNGNLATTQQLLGQVALGDREESYVSLALRSESTDRSGLTVPRTSPETSFDNARSENDVSHPRSAFLDGALDLGPLGSLHAQYHLQILDAHGEFSDLSTLSHGNRIARKNEVLGLDHRLKLLDDSLQVHTYATYSFGGHLPQERLDIDSDLYIFKRHRKYRNLFVGSEFSYSRWGHVILVGFEAQRLWDRGDRTFTVVTDPTADNYQDRILRTPGEVIEIADYAPFAQLILTPLDGLSLTAGLRRNWNDVWGSTLNYRLAATYEVYSGLSTKVVHGTSFMPPAPVQVQSSPLGLTGGIVGNPDLASQKASTTEIEIAYRHHDLFDVFASSFFTKIKDRVEFLYNGGEFTARNIDATRSFGFEVGGRLLIEPFFSSVSASYQATSPTEDPEPVTLAWRTLYSEDGEGGRRALYTPAWMARWDVGIHDPEHYVEASVATAYVGERKSSMANIVLNRAAYLLSSYFLVDATVRTLGIELLPERATTLSVHINNVLDAEYSQPGYLGVDIPGMGRSIFVRLSQDF